MQNLVQSNGSQLSPDTQEGSGNTRGELPGNLYSVCAWNDRLTPCLKTLASGISFLFNTEMRKILLILRACHLSSSSAQETLVSHHPDFTPSRGNLLCPISVQSHLQPAPPPCGPRAIFIPPKTRSLINKRSLKPLENRRGLSAHSGTPPQTSRSASLADLLQATALKGPAFFARWEASSRLFCPGPPFH